jgi:hypothetical protein
MAIQSAILSGVEAGRREHIKRVDREKGVNRKKKGGY